MSNINPLNLLLAFLLLAVVILGSAQYLFPRPVNSTEGFARFIRQNPQLIAESLENYYSSGAAPVVPNTLLRESHAALYNDKNIPILGNSSNKKVIVEFFDYQCGYCKKANMILMDIHQEHPDITIILHPYPVLSDFSMYLSQVALAVYHLYGQERFLEVHTRFLNPQAPALRNKDDIANALEALKIKDWEKEAEKKKYKTILENSIQLGTQLHFSGVPTFIINDQLYSGLLEKSTLLSKLSS